MVTRGIPYASDADESLQVAVGRVTMFRGSPRLLPEPLLFTQQVVLDSLSVAPAPVTKSWVKSTLAAVGSITRWAHSTGQPLTRDHIFDEETRFRHRQSLTDLTVDTARMYHARLELLADHLNGAVIRRMPRATTIQTAPVEPLTATEEADLWNWTRGIQGDQALARVQAFIAFGLGVGLIREEKYRLKSDDVAIDGDGVHVTVTHHVTGDTRVVTCLGAWEDRLAALVRATPPGHYMTAPWRNTLAALGTTDQSMKKANNRYRPPVEYNNSRLRTTWLCHHLQSGTELKVLLAAAGMKEGHHLQLLLPFLPPLDPAHARRSLRGAR